MMMLSASIGAACSLLGLYVSYHLNLASGGLVVIFLSVLFFGTWLLGPKHGVLQRRRRWTLEGDTSQVQSNTVMPAIAPDPEG